jgi:hypothetical protein
VKRRQKRLNDPLRGITRMDYKRAQGWFYRYQRNGKSIAQFFAAKKHGGWVKALERTKRYRAKIEKQHGEFPYLWVVRQKDKRSRTGVVGVTYLEYWKCNTINRQRYCYRWRGYVAKWGSPITKYVRRQFSIDRLGKGEAFKQACRARRQGTAAHVRYWKAR